MEIVRHAPPTKLDHAVYGSTCIIHSTTGEFDIYLQTSQDDADPEWEHLGNFNEQSAHLIEDEIAQRIKF
jgi:hypothetical protein